MSVRRLRRRIPIRAVFPLVALLFGVAPAALWAHSTQLSSSRAAVSGNAVNVEVELNARDLEAALRGTILRQGNGVDSAALEGAREAIARYVLTHARVLAGAEIPCQGRAQGVLPKAEHVVVRVAWHCPAVPGDLRYRVTLFQEVDPASRHMVVVSGDARRVALLSVSTPQTTLAQTRVGGAQTFQRYLLAGIEHIVIGYDHIAFLLAVIVWGRRIRPLVAAVTAFTIAHSVTLALAALDWVRLPSQVVEVAIALSIVLVAGQNFFVRERRHRARVTFAFGLVHGFGFASVLRDYGIPSDAAVLALAAFNIGVEIGQVAIVLLALLVFTALAYVLARSKRGRELLVRLPDLISGVILLLGLYWMAERSLAFVALR
ncbi:MAG TPA: HupE/UreJ family protein [Burkholderiales bacterium]|nr:HupE/UreJ family protein [Burkholderiales bacterium]